jgi:nucleoside phosphorylase
MGGGSKLSGADVKRLQDALLSAFPMRSALAQVVRVGLDENLDAIAASENLRAAVFELIWWAEAQGRLEELIGAVRAANPGNAHLRAFMERQVQDRGGHLLEPWSGHSASSDLPAPRLRAGPGSSAGGVKREGEDQVDVLIVTAVKDEWDAVLAVDTGAKPGSAWEKRRGASGPEVAYRDFTTEGGALCVAVVQAFEMGREQAVIAAAPLLELHPEIRCVAMCGVCAGRRGDVALGDVIVADRTWPYDAGKIKAAVDEHGRRTERFQGDMDLYRIHPPEWKQRAERFQPDPAAPWIKDRPRSYEEQGDWVLERLARNEDPVAHPDRPVKCPDWGKVLKQLWKVKRLEEGEVKLTEAGRQHIRRRMTLEPDGLRDPGPFKVVVGPIASGAPVLQDTTVFDRLAETAGMRKVVGLEMETSAILALAYLRKVQYAVVMKGVMDHADTFKSDNMKTFAARASAECLVAFLRQNLGVKEERRTGEVNEIVSDALAAPVPWDQDAYAGPAYRAHQNSLKSKDRRLDQDRESRVAKAIEPHYPKVLLAISSIALFAIALAITEYQKQEPSRLILTGGYVGTILAVAISAGLAVGAIRYARKLTAWSTASTRVAFNPDRVRNDVAFLRGLSFCVSSEVQSDADEAASDGDDSTVATDDPDWKCLSDVTGGEQDDHAGLE